jgi:hypothetical protein
MSSPLPVNPTSQLAESLPGFDAAPVINAGEQRLADYLGMPTQQILNQFGPQQLSTAAPTASTIPDIPANPGGPITPVGPAQLISPVVQALSTLGTGQFSGMDPTAMFNEISNSFNSTAGPVQQALSAVEGGWQGAAHAATVAKTTAALANGAQVGTQATGLSSSLSTAVADVAQAQTQLIAIINQFFATVAAIGPMIIFPWGWAAVLAAAAQAVTHAAGVMTEVQSSLATQAAAVTAIGSPVSVASAPQLGTSGASMAGVASSLLGGSSSAASSPMSSMGMLAPLAMSGAMAGMSPAMSAASAAGNAGNPAAAGATTGALVGDKAADPKAAAAGAALAGKAGAHAAPVSPAGGGGGAAASGALAGRVTAPPMAAPETTGTVPASAARLGTGGVPMTGGGMMGGAPVAGAGHAANAGGAHTAASYLHTSDHGEKVVKDRSTVAPPVIGEVDPHETPDIDLRI